MIVEPSTVFAEFGRVLMLKLEDEGMSVEQFATAYNEAVDEMGAGFVEVVAA